MVSTVRTRAGSPIENGPGASGPAAHPPHPRSDGEQGQGGAAGAEDRLRVGA